MQYPKSRCHHNLVSLSLHLDFTDPSATFLSLLTVTIMVIYALLSQFFLDISSQSSSVPRAALTALILHFWHCQWEAEGRLVGQCF